VTAADPKAPRLGLDAVLQGAGAVWGEGSYQRPKHVRGVSIDTRSLAAGELFFAIVGPRFDGHAFLAQARERGAAAAVVQHEAPAPPDLPLLRVADTTRALADTARYVRQAAALPVVAVTGSLGKTTTKEITAGLVAPRGPVLKTEGNLNNHFGLPLTLLRLREEHRTAVLELGMSAAGELRHLSGIARPDVAVITRVAPVHLEFFPSLEAIARAKGEILEGLSEDGTAVLNADDAQLRPIGQAHGGRVVWFGRHRQHEVSAEKWRGTAHGMRFDLLVEGQRVDVALPLPGTHNVTNFLAAAAAAHVLGVKPETMAAAATRLRPARHRGEVLRLGRRMTLLDDCYNSSPEAVDAAVGALNMTAHARCVAVLGDMLELGSQGPELHHRSGQRLAGRVELVLGVGPLARHILEGAREAGLPPHALHHFPDAPAAAGALPDLLRDGDAILVKGSRAVRLEVVVERLLECCGPQEQVG